ncbi:MAG TPA: class I SAM-dependent methyltransferase [Candidatus Acidoferrum sp.]|nr:class I SAM-dependent methyltransferase [Candidatus Acidoferrum sp.]
MTPVASALRHRLRSVAARAGLQPERLWHGLATRAYRRKLARDVDFREWWSREGQRIVEGHWGHEELHGEFKQLHLASQLYELTGMLRRRVGTVGDARVLDAAASDGFFLSRLGVKRGVGVNILLACARKIRSDGSQACLADLERLPFADQAFDYVVSCETLEHVRSPLAALDELIRVAARRIFLTIPWMLRTRITHRPHGWPNVESHIFEFSEADFSKVLSYARVKIVYQSRVQVFPEPVNPLTQWWLGTLMYPNYFPKLQYYELEPIR